MSTETYPRVNGCKRPPKGQLKKIAVITGDGLAPADRTIFIPQKNSKQKEQPGIKRRKR